ncbi:hypothetical protein ASPTUDRAFT_365564 [Aspergillus tubingensis CBS 134.48]|uniref:Uncharacterized protein n=1 Tax=Aspergillus tubingensis (strain CBS 134.48) TaxID=767770 RepID=A0A1L9NIG1_ASPTC|nr:hypothetical protein ASPTUDRAFT_365564 [Aspergillus tubingensis CBS 134.48]
MICISILEPFSEHVVLQSCHDPGSCLLPFLHLFPLSLFPPLYAFLISISFFLLPDRVLMAGVPCSWAGLGKCDGDAWIASVQLSLILWPPLIIDMAVTRMVPVVEDRDVMT